MPTRLPLSTSPGWPQVLAERKSVQFTKNNLNSGYFFTPFSSGVRTDGSPPSVRADGNPHTVRSVYTQTATPIPYAVCTHRRQPPYRTQCVHTQTTIPYRTQCVHTDGNSLPYAMCTDRRQSSVRSVYAQTLIPSRTQCVHTDECVQIDGNPLYAVCTHRRQSLVFRLLRLA